MVPGKLLHIPGSPQQRGRGLLICLCGVAVLLQVPLHSAKGWLGEAAGAGSKATAESGCLPPQLRWDHHTMASVKKCR